MGLAPPHSRKTKQESGSLLRHVTRGTKHPRPRGTPNSSLYWVSFALGAWGAQDKHGDWTQPSREVLARGIRNWGGGMGGGCAGTWRERAASAGAVTGVSVWVLRGAEPWSSLPPAPGTPAAPASRLGAVEFAERLARLLQPVQLLLEEHPLGRGPVLLLQQPGVAVLVL